MSTDIHPFVPNQEVPICPVDICIQYLVRYSLSVGHSQNNTFENYSVCIEKAKTVLNQWCNRALSIIGKVNIINTLVASLFVYKFAAIPRIPDVLVTKLYSLFNNFLWKGRRAKIPLRTLQLPTAAGGLNLVDIKARDEAIKITWIQVLRKDCKSAALAYYFFAQRLHENVWRCNLELSDIDQLLPRVRNPFWFDVLCAWSVLNYDPVDVEGQLIWYNSLIRIENKCIWWPECFNAGLMYAEQLYPDGLLIGVKPAWEKYKLDPMRLNALISAIPRHWKTAIREDKKGGAHLYDKLIDAKGLSRWWYKNLMRRKKLYTNKHNLWEAELEMGFDERDLTDAAKHIFSVTNVPKLRSFQYRLVHKAIVVNSHLFQWGIKNSNLCTFCGDKKETLVHLFYDCDITRALWSDVLELMNSYSRREVVFNQKTVLMNSLVSENGHIKNFICLVVKYYIYSQRCADQPVVFSHVKNYIQTFESIEKYIAIKNSKLGKHLRKWCPDSQTNDSLT